MRRRWEEHSRPCEIAHSKTLRQAGGRMPLSSICCPGDSKGVFSSLPPLGTQRMFWNSHNLSPPHPNPPQVYPFPATCTGCHLTPASHPLDFISLPSISQGHQLPTDLLHSRRCYQPESGLGSPHAPLLIHPPPALPRMPGEPSVMNTPMVTPGSKGG